MNRFKPPREKEASSRVTLHMFKVTPLHNIMMCFINHKNRFKLVTNTTYIHIVTRAYPTFCYHMNNKPNEHYTYSRRIKILRH